jgi:hypothetical protein
MAIGLGRSLMVVLVILLSFYFAIQWVFILAAFSVIIFNLLGGAKEERILAEV